MMPLSFLARSLSRSLPIFLFLHIFLDFPLVGLIKYVKSRFK